MTLPVEIQARMDEIHAEIEGAGAELIELHFRRVDQRSILTFLVDKAGGISLEDCAKLNQRLGAFFQGRYLLEVSSPGLDRPLKTPKDFGRAVNDWIRVTCQNGAASQGPVIGKLSAVTESGIELEGKDGVRRQVSFGDIAKATREISWKH